MATRKKNTDCFEKTIINGMEFQKLIPTTENRQKVIAKRFSWPNSNFHHAVGQGEQELETLRSEYAQKYFLK